MKYIFPKWTPEISCQFAYTVNFDANTMIAKPISMGMKNCFPIHVLSLLSILCLDRSRRMFYLPRHISSIIYPSKCQCDAGYIRGMCQRLEAKVDQYVFFFYVSSSFRTLAIMALHPFLSFVALNKFYLFVLSPKH